MGVGSLEISSMIREGFECYNVTILDICMLIKNRLYSTYSIINGEWRAVYYENIIRSQLGIPLRTHYGYDISTSIIQGIGPLLLLPTNQPINYK